MAVGLPRRRPTPRRRGSARLSPVEVLAIAGSSTLVFVPLVAFGAAAPQPALLLAGAAALTAVWLLFALPQRRGESCLTYDQVVAGGALLLLLVLGLWTASPWSAPWATPGWSLVPGPGSASLDRFATRVEVVKLTGLAGAFTVGAVIGGSKPRRDAMAKVLLVLAGLYTVLAAAAYLAQPAYVLGTLKHIHNSRFTGTFFSANTAAALFGVFAVLALARPSSRGPGRSWWRDIHSWDMRLWDWWSLGRAVIRTVGPTLLFWSALLWTGSRGALISTGMASLVVVALRTGGSPVLADMVLSSRHRFWAWPLVCAAVCSGLAGIAIATTQGEVSGGDASDRHGLYTMMAHAWLNRPWLGYGLGSFQTMNDHLAHAAKISTSWSLAAGHDLYLQWGMEGGALGTALIMIVVAFVLLPVMRRALVDRSTLSLGVLGASLVLLFQNTLDFSLQVFGVAVLWAFLLGLGGAGGRNRCKGQRAPAGGDSSDADTAAALVRPKARRPASERRPSSTSSRRARFS